MKYYNQKYGVLHWILRSTPITWEYLNMREEPHKTLLLKSGGEYERWMVFDGENFWSVVEGRENSNEKRVDFYLIQECLKILERAEESHRFRLKSTSQLHQQ